MKNKYVVLEGEYLDNLEGIPVVVCEDREIAETFCKNSGYMYDIRYKLFINKEVNNWRSINKIRYIGSKK